VSRPVPRATRIGTALDAAVRAGAVHEWTVTRGPAGAVWTIRDTTLGPVRRLTTAQAEVYLVGVAAGARATRPALAVRDWMKRAHDLEETDA